jgi:hypothetical protein
MSDIVRAQAVTKGKIGKNSDIRHTVMGPDGVVPGDKEGGRHDHDVVRIEVR